MFLACDLQHKVADYLINYDTMAKNSARLAQTAELLTIPVVATSHVKFGDIDPSIKEKFYDGVKIFPNKNTFSMINEAVREHMTSLGRSKVVLFGAETHICIKQTAFDLLEAGHEVHIVVDAVTSMSASDRNIGLQMLKEAGAKLTTF